MGSSQTKNIKTDAVNPVTGLKNKIDVLQREMNEIMRIRDAENQAYEQELMVFAFKQAEWRRERKRLKEEVKKLSKSLEEKLQDNNHNDDCELEYYNLMGKSNFCSSLEQKRRDQTVEKWKQLYFAIKLELDHLIQRTHQEERLCGERREDQEDVIVELKKEVKAKEERIEILKAKLASMEHQQSKREREMDILRQSLRIMSHKTKLGKRSIKEF